MKIAFCLFNYFPFGGLQRDFLRIALTCQKQGHEIVVYTMEWEGNIPEGFQINLIKKKGFSNHMHARNFSYAVMNALKHSPCDRIVGFNKMPGLDIYYAADSCFVAKANNKHGCFYRKLPRYRIYQQLENAVFNSNSKTQVLLISEAEKPHFIQCYQTRSENFHLLKPGISQDRKRPTNYLEIRRRVREKFKLRDNDFMLLMVGSGFKTKGLDRTLHSIAALPKNLLQNTQLFIIGDDKAKQFRKLAQELNIQEHIQFLGGRHDVPDFLWSADLLLHPAYYENTGTVLLEALVAGLPVLTTANCGYAHYITTAQAGQVIADPYQQVSFNEALASALQSADLRIQWQNNALKFAESADIYRMTDQALYLIEQAENAREKI